MNYSRAVGDSQGSSRSDRVGLVALDNRGWSWAVGGILADSLGGGDPDGRNPGRIGWRRNIGTGGRGISRRRNSVGDSARAVSDGQGLTCQTCQLESKPPVQGRTYWLWQCMSWFLG